MRIIVSQNINGNEPPKNKIEQMWLLQHQEELELAQKENILKNNVEVVIKRVGKKYMTGSKPLRVKIGEILEGKIKLQEEEK